MPTSGDQDNEPSSQKLSSNHHLPEDFNQDSLHNNNLHPVMSTCFPITLKFIDLCYKVKIEENNKRDQGIRSMLCGGGGTSMNPPDQRSSMEKTILNGITGMALPGELLAVLGPSGSGKSTVLNALAGRLHGHNLTGSVLTNDKKISKFVSKRIGFVSQDDLLYPHLTVRETLTFCSLLRLPNTLSKAHKIQAVDSVISELGLGKCEDTIIGNGFIRGVSGGERKRVSIAHEMLVNPSLLILDEPTSGLDSTAAHRLVMTLSSLARKGRKTVVASVHQPSSRVYQVFNSVLVLSEGRSLYFGKGSEALAYFGAVGYQMSFPMNPADFLLDLANGVCHIDGISERDRPNIRESLVSSYNTVLAPKVKAACIDSSAIAPKEALVVCRENKTSRWLSSWFNQFSILLQRSLKERKHESFNSLRVFQVIAASLLAGFMWWHSDFQDIQDRLGLLFFIAIFWGVFPSFNSVFAFPQERAMFLKERSSGMYTLSPYFMSRIVGDLPLELILPTVFLTITYWMAGLRPELSAFLLTLVILLGYVLVSQGLGLALGAAIMDAKQASTIVTVTMLAFVLTGGFYVHKVPCGLSWIKYISTTYYTYKLLIRVQYGDGEEISSLLGCHYSNAGNASVCKFVEQDIRGQISPLLSVAILFFMFIGYRVLAYLALRRIKV